ncbi:protein Largen-like [Myxocyprinus asiaticus]|uniref:protein Largen-like n=1 Tax=Myxocyprinus asiaticus TaxID=70543 RepID=UPI0022215187|nr:protein Largen-like [Myxocyprinus asiaticus]
MSDGPVNKVRVKRQIRTIVKDLENILGDLKDVAKELKEVVHEIDCLTSDLHLEEEMTDSSKTDTLNSSSSSTTTTTVSSIDKIKIYPEEMLFRPASVPPAVLTVLKRPHPPLPPPRMTPSRSEEYSDGLSSRTPPAANGTVMQNRVFPVNPINVLSKESCCGVKSVTAPSAPLLKLEKSRCPQTTRERVRFSEKVQYLGYCPDCDLQCDVNNTDLHLHTELIDGKLSPLHQCSSSLPAQVLLDNGSLGFPSKKPHKTILRHKSTTTTV